MQTRRQVLPLVTLNHRILEPLQLEKITKIIQTNCQSCGLEGTSGDHHIWARECIGTQLIVHAWLIANHRACAANSCIIHTDSLLTSQT